MRFYNFLSVSWGLLDKVRYNFTILCQNFFHTFNGWVYIDRGIGMKNKNTTLRHCQNNTKIKDQNRRKRPIYTPNTKIHDRSLSWLGTVTSIARFEVKLVKVLWAQTSPLREKKNKKNTTMMLLCKCFPHVNKMPTFPYNQANRLFLRML